jgi:diaminohydroxyphosphoribosylaminopyrimidine deaminase / 5-amino-6-(5-phosphoribosylamino)uracil reductase
MNEAEDRKWMARALELAARGGREVRPNPRVGAVLVSSKNQVLGQGWHARFGGPHAEVGALADAPDVDLDDCTLYVNLEPCCYHGKTPPCTDLILRKGVGRVVVGALDANPRVAGSGVAALRQAGVAVETGVLEAECRAIIAGFLTRMKLGRPWVSLKIAQSLDGFMAPAQGPSRWITGPESRARVHLLRAEADGVLTGTGTMLADNPALTVRHVPGPQPRRIFLDRRGIVPKSSRLLSDEHVPATIAVTATGRSALFASLRAAGGTVLEVATAAGALSLPDILRRLGELKIQHLLVEGGPTLASSLLEAGMVDELMVFTAPILLGGGKPSAVLPHRGTLNDAIRPLRTQYERLGDDNLTTLTLRLP